MSAPAQAVSLATLKPSIRLLIPLLAVLVMAQDRYNQTLPLSGDEAYYWVWSHHLKAGYFDHPPMIALLIAAVTRSIGDTVEAIRLGAALTIAGTLFLQVRLAEKFGGALAGWLALAIGMLLPAFEMGFTLATPDDPLAFFWSLGLTFALPALTGPGRWRDYLLMGAACGLAMASKYTGVLLPASLLLYLALTAPRQLLSPKMWAAGAAALAMFAPVLWWNASHGFESFLFQYRHGSETLGESGFQGKAFLEFLGGQALVISPLLMILLLAGLARWRRWWGDPAQRLMVIAFLLPMALFLEKALFAKIQLNWALPAYLSVLPLLAAGLLELPRRRQVIMVALFPALMLTVAIKFPLSLGLTGKNNPQNRLFGPETAARALEPLRQPDDEIFADHLQRASLLTFYLAGHPRVYIPTETRFSEYSHWDEGVPFAQMHGLYLSQDDRSADLGKVFGKVEMVEKLHSYRPGGRAQNYYVFRVGPGE